MSTNYDLYKIPMKCIDCKKHTHHKPWDHPERKKRCAACYLKFCEVKSEEELDPDLANLFTKSE